jgi:hypothetical protein
MSMTIHDEELEPMSEWAMEPTSVPERVATTPQDWGLPHNPNTEQLQVWFRQEAFLKAYARCGKRGKAASLSGITRWCVDKWVSSDVYNIRKRMELAHADYVESLEEDLDSAINDDPKARYAMPAAVQRIFRLKAEAPEKYREEVKVLNVDASKQMLDRLMELGKKELEQPEPPALEGEFREVEGKNQS